MNEYYEKIMSLQESDDIKNIVNRWNNFSKNKIKLPHNAPIVLPDMLWITKPGYGKTSLLNLISEYLSSEHLMEFYGDVKFFEFTLAFRNKDNFEIEIDRFNNAVLNAAGFRNEFKGVICINIDEWIDHTEDKRFIEFLDFLSLNTYDWHIIFSIESKKQNQIDKIEALLSMYFRLEKVVFKMPETQELLEYIKDNIGIYGFELDKKSETILNGAIRELREGQYFDGYKTLNMISTDLIYHMASQDEFEGFVITEKIASQYSPEGEFIKRTKKNIEKRNRIGFETIGGEEFDK